MITLGGAGESFGMIRDRVHVTMVIHKTPDWIITDTRVGNRAYQVAVSWLNNTDELAAVWR